MTRVEATRKLAEKVMGVKTPPNIPWRDGSDYLLESKPLVAWYNEPDNYPCINVFASCSPMAICWKFGDAAKPYSPWTNTRQALDLAEAWRKQDYRQRWYAIDSPSPNTPNYQTQITEYSRGLDYVCIAAEFAAALTGAVCKAEGIEVEEA